MSKRYRIKARSFMLDCAVHAALNAEKKGWHVRAVATGVSLPGPFGRNYLNGPERSFVERFLRTRFDDYSHLRPNVHGNRSQDYINLRYAATEQTDLTTA